MKTEKEPVGYGPKDNDDDLSKTELFFISLVGFGGLFAIYDLIHNVSVWWSEAFVQATL